MRATRLVSTAAASLAAGGVLLIGVPAQADAIFVEVNPTTIQAGFPVSIRASCGPGVDTATVKSEAFGEIVLVKEFKELVAAVTIPEKTRPRGFTVKLTCPSTNTATTTLWVVGMPAPTRGPHTGGGFLANGGTNASDEQSVPTAVVAGSTAGALSLGTAVGWFLVRRRRARQR